MSDYIEIPEKVIVDAYNEVVGGDGSEDLLSAFKVVAKWMRDECVKAVEKSCIQGCDCIGHGGDCDGEIVKAIHLIGKESETR